MIAALLLLLALASPALAADDATGVPDHAGLVTEVVGISPGRLIPTVKRVASTEAFGWINYAARDASIAFDARVAERMTCRGPSPFRIEAEQLLASPVSGGGFATLCKLEPGEYGYEVRLAGSPQPLLGKLVVGRATE